MENLRGALLMTAAMASFAVEDALIKALSREVPTGQLVLVLSLGGALCFAVLLRLRGLPVFSRQLLAPAVILRSLAELFGGLGFVLAITLGDLSTATAILQATPLAVVAGAGLMLGEKVGWRRWTAVGLGFLGVLIVVRPGTAEFDPVSLFALVGVIGLAFRDLVTRRMPKGMPSLMLSMAAYAAMVPGGLLLLLVQGQPMVSPSPLAWAGMAAMLVIGMGAYMMIVAATRLGELSVIAPFRFSRIVFALILAAVFFGERPDAATYLGAAIIILSSVYAIWRERVAQRRRAASLAGQGRL